ncbi:beta-lactamase family protein [Ophiostoma piceae UAMH 11346]|uniref:Beta-lactamase family protein n=1 Tax=Ophiostoma piceae (strain UAMH 11346) TaxID=1262450 RepID=S3BXQ9_OPHP1|nr:beta-lactamase family protein [Ophiostoma piceae UAMH 11346]
MKPFSLVLLLLTRGVVSDFATAGWPAPADLSSNSSLVSKAFLNVTDTLEQYIEDDGKTTALPPLLSGIKNLTFSVGVFSVHDTEAAKSLQFHYTAPEIAGAGNGTTSVDADSIYRIASVTKVLTVLSGLIHLSPQQWDRPLASIFPVLTAYQHNYTVNGLSVDWEAVTLRSLAAQISGVPRDGLPSGNELLILEALGQVDPATMGLPPSSPTDILENPPCIELLATGASACPETPYLESVSNRPPVFSSWGAPAYANNGFVILGMALAKLTNTSYADLVKLSVFGPLAMNSSNINTPPKNAWNRSVIAYPQEPTAYFDIEAGVLAGSGAASSTLNDMARLGVGILQSQLLAPAETRRWLQPVSFTGRLQYAVGAPWEIHRFTLPNNKVIDIYSKFGDSGAYSSFFVLLPDYGIGFTLLAASSELKLRADILAAITDVVTYTLLPAIASQAAREAAAKYAGTYCLGNSSLTLIVNQTALGIDGPGLVISNWTSKGTDVLASPFVTYSGVLPFRLVPSIPDPTGKHQSFRMLSATDEPSAQLPISDRLFSGIGFLAADWILADSLTYGGIGTTLFQFNVESGSKAISVTISAFRETLPRK